MRVHAELKMIDAGEVKVRPWYWLAVSLAGFLFWSAVIAAVRQAAGLA